MRHRLLAALAALPLLLTGTVTATAVPEPARYAALGDSYAAGVGAGSYESGSGDCHRSTLGYPALWSAAHHPAAFLNAACLGATTADVQGGQLSRVPADSTLITVTAGGNDLGFAEAVVACLQPLTTDARCDHALDESERRVRDELPDRLAGLYRAIADHAPAARVVVTGYPDLLRTQATCPIGTDRRRTRFNGLADRLDELIHRQSTAQGFEFVDVRAAFSGHGACTGGSGEWIHGITLPLWESFHPTRTGHADGYLPTVTAAIED